MENSYVSILMRDDNNLNCSYAIVKKADTLYSVSFSYKLIAKTLIINIKHTVIEKQNYRKYSIFTVLSSFLIIKSSVEGIITEVKEEIGVDLDESKLELYFSRRSDEEQVFWDDYYIKMDIEDLSNLQYIGRI